MIIVELEKELKKKKSQFNKANEEYSLLEEQLTASLTRRNRLRSNVGALTETIEILKGEK